MCLKVMLKKHWHWVVPLKATSVITGSSAGQCCRLLSVWVSTICLPDCPMRLHKAGIKCRSAKPSFLGSNSSFDTSSNVWPWACYLISVCPRTYWYWGLNELIHAECKMTFQKMLSTKKHQLWTSSPKAGPHIWFWLLLNSYAQAMHSVLFSGAWTWQSPSCRLFLEL